MNKNYDIFNGDADGICALQQLRLKYPKKAELVTGLKRDIALLNNIKANKDDAITVLDVSLDKNRQGLLNALEIGAKVFYSDHHFTGEIPKHNNLNIQIDLSADTCTALIINKYLANAFPEWAIVGAFGDNQDEAANQLAKQNNLNQEQSKQLKQLGICLNYNGYGFTLDDLIFHPAELYKKCHPYASPFEFIQKDLAFEQLFKAYNKDMALAKQQGAFEANNQCKIYILPNKKWARRVNGVFGNQLARQNPQKAHAVLVQAEKGYRVSVRAPLENKAGADELCRKFKDGGGRKAAAGINFLPEQQLQEFIKLFKEQFSR